MKRFSSFALVLILLLCCMASAEGSWTCPNCGRTGNLGNFCGNCAEPRPSVTPAPEPTAHVHDIAAATCEAASYCRTCGQTFGEPLGHDVVGATYTMPMYCKRCWKTLGDPLTMPTNDWTVGNTVFFGTYPQTAEGNDNTPIEWIVLDVQGDKALLISRYALDCVQYNTKVTDVTWETCTLRKWLNNDFYNKAFSAGEKRNIVLSKVTADKNPSYSTNPGNATDDNVFLLSITEVNRYFKDNASRRCAPTDYAVKNGSYTSNNYKVDGRGCCWWWLRSPGYSGGGAATVLSDGSVDYLGFSVNRSYSGVRPCVRVRLF